MKADTLRNIVAEVLGCELSTLADDRELAAMETWDSLNLLRIVTAVEEEFAIRLTMDEIQRIDTLGTLAGLVSRKVNSR